jgi:hypothetical protein
MASGQKIEGFRLIRNTDINRPRLRPEHSKQIQIKIRHYKPFMLQVAIPNQDNRMLAFTRSLFASESVIRHA